MLTIQTVMITGGKEERKQLTISAKEGGVRTRGKPARGCGREEEIEGDEGSQQLIILITRVGLLVTPEVEDLQTLAGPSDCLGTDHAPTEGDTTWLRGDSILDPSCHLHLSLLCFL